MAKSYMGKGPGPSGAARSFQAGPGGGKTGIKAVRKTMPNVAMPQKAASPSVKGMSVYSNTKKIGK